MDLLIKFPIQMIFYESTSSCLLFFEDNALYSHIQKILFSFLHQDACQAIHQAIENIANGDMNVIVKPDPKQKQIYWFHNELAKLLHGESKFKHKASLVNWQ